MSGYRVTVKGFRSREVVLSTTLLDAETYPAEELADLYFQRWEIEVDFRHLKITMQMDVLRGHSPEVGEKEFWAHVLAYNLLRSLMWDAGERYGETPTKLSLKGALQHLLPHWPPSGRKQFAEEFGDLLALIAAEWLSFRPGRVEPRVRKRRPKQYALMSIPRHKLKMTLSSFEGGNASLCGHVYSYAALLRFKRILANAAVGAEKILARIFPLGSGRDVLTGFTGFGVIDITADSAYILLHSEHPFLIYFQ